MKRFSFIFQIFFKLFLTFMLVFVWVRFFTKSLILAIFISAIITGIIDILSRLFFNKKKKIKELKSQEKIDAENIFLSLAIDGNALSFYEKAFNQDVIEKHKNFIVINKTAILYPQMMLTELSINDIAKIMKSIKKFKAKTIIIPCGDIQNDCFNFIKIFDEEIIILDKYATYQQIYKKKKTFPEITRKVKENGNESLKHILSLSFTKARVKGYVISALALIFCSLFVKATLYYTIFSSVLLVFALISFIRPNQTKIKTTELF